MNFKIRSAAISLLGLSIAVVLLLAYPEVNRSRAKARAVVPAAESRIATPAAEEGSATLSPANMHTWPHFYFFSEAALYCGRSDYSPGVPEDIPGTVVAGFKHRFDGGAKFLGCPWGAYAVYRGTVWFDLSEIISKAPPLHVSVDRATLHFKVLSGGCPADVLIATIDWSKGYNAKPLLPGDPLVNKSGLASPFGMFSSCTGGCNIDVTVPVSNWLKGLKHGGYANYGFVFKGMKESDIKYEDNEICLSRYGDISLTVNYKYDAETVKSVPGSYPLVCRGTDALKIMDFDGPVPFRWVGFNFIPGTGPAKDGLRPGQCSWVDRAMRPGETARLAQPIEKTLVWNKELNSSDSYWTFYVYNAGDQLQATGAERSKRPDIDVAKPGAPFPLGDTTAFARTNVALASNLAKASATSVVPGYAASGAIDGDEKGLNPGKDGYWNSAKGGLPATLEVVFDGTKTITEIDLFTIQDNYASPADPRSGALEFKLYGLTDFNVEYWNESTSSWMRIPFGLVRDNKLVWNHFDFSKSPITTSKIRVVCFAAPDSTGRIAELEAWGK